MPWGADGSSCAVDAALVLLVVGHVFGDFLLQTHRMAEAKATSVRALLAHSGLVFVGQFAVLAPVLGGAAAVAGAAAALGHLLVDAGRTRALGGRSETLGAFFLDQGLHVATLLLVWAFVLGPWRVGGLRDEAAGWLAVYVRSLAVLAAFAFNGSGATAIVRKTLERYPAVVPKPSDGSDEYAMGRVIGCLERFVILILLMFNQWGAVGFVIAAKSIARFPELRDRTQKDFTEYYLIGTLTSILVAIATGVALRCVLC